jgi:hypothetical protein
VPSICDSLAFEVTKITLPANILRWHTICGPSVMAAQPTAIYYVSNPEARVKPTYHNRRICFPFCLGTSMHDYINIPSPDSMT